MEYRNYYTYKEIKQQPECWRKEYESILSGRDRIAAFMNRYVSEGYEVILTGAGTSAYIGDALTYVLPYKSCSAVATTDIVTNYKSFFTEGRKVLLISFARSGNSPESVAAVNIADQVLGENVAHVFITCNAEGELAKRAALDKENVLLVLLPPETNDKSLAMTSSFSTMSMACLMLANINEIEKVEASVNAVAKMAEKVLEQYEDSLRQVSEKGFMRAVFLGSGMLKGIAEESRLKLQELTDGEVMCAFDSFLGFRHGPKAVVKEGSLLVYLVSSDPYIRQYEIDLIKQINSNNSGLVQVLVSNDKVEVEGVEFDAEIILKPEASVCENYLYVSYVIAAQMLGFFKSLSMGFSPDSPSKSGNIHRVVEGVTIYNL